MAQEHSAVQQFKIKLTLTRNNRMICQDMEVIIRTWKNRILDYTRTFEEMERTLHTDFAITNKHEVSLTKYQKHHNYKRIDFSPNLMATPQKNVCHTHLKFKTFFSTLSHHIL